MEIDSSNISQVQQLQQQPQQQQAVQQRAFEEDLAAQEQARQTVEAAPAAEESQDQNATSDYTNLIREARTQQAPPQVVQEPTSNSEGDEAPDAQHVAVAAYENNRENFEAPTSSGQLLPKVDAIV